MPSEEFKPGKELVKIFKEIKEYFELKYDIFKLEITENLIKILSGFYTFFVLVSLVTTSALFFSFAAAYYLGALFNSLPLGFMLVGMVYFLMIFLLLILRKRIITRPLIKFVSKVIFKNKKD